MATALGSVRVHSLKKKIIGAMSWRTYNVPGQIQLREYSRGGAYDGLLYNGEVWAVNANWNPDNGYWNVEANSVSNPNPWNAGNQILSRDPILSWRVLLRAGFS